MSHNNRSATGFDTRADVDADAGDEILLCCHCWKTQQSI